jgi:hypothetical protein
MAMFLSLRVLMWVLVAGWKQFRVTTRAIFEMKCPVSKIDVTFIAGPACAANPKRESDR